MKTIQKKFQKLTTKRRQRRTQHHLRQQQRIRQASCNHIRDILGMSLPRRALIQRRGARFRLLDAGRQVRRRHADERAELVMRVTAVFEVALVALAASCSSSSLQERRSLGGHSSLLPSPDRKRARERASGGYVFIY
jgi:hypothetical protein